MQVAPAFGCASTAPCACCNPHVNCRLNVSAVWGTRVHLDAAGELLQSGCGYMRVAACAPLPLMEQFAFFPSGHGSPNELAYTASRQSAVTNSTANSTQTSGRRTMLSEAVQVGLGTQEHVENRQHSHDSGGMDDRVMQQTTSDAGERTTVAAQLAESAVGVSAYALLGDAVVVEAGRTDSSDFRQPLFVAPNITGLEPDSYYAGEISLTHRPVLA
jgi:hypothetical protein